MWFKFRKVVTFGDGADSNGEGASQGLQER